MLYILFAFLMITPVLIGFGSFFQRYFGMLWAGLSGKIVSGIIFLIVLWHLLAFFIPINQYVEWGSFLVGILLFFKYKGFVNDLKIKELYLWLGAFFIVALAGSGYPFILDHFGYYVPSIKWLSEYGLVKGITNLNWVLGQMSPWHIFQAGFSHFLDSFLRVNALLLMFFILYIIERKAWVMLCFSSILLFFVQSPSPDLPSIVFSLMILNEILKRNKEFTLLFAFSILVFTIKPTMIWVPILAFLYPIFIFKANLKFIWLGILLGILYIVKNIWVFGYPLFPMNILDLGIAWKPYDELFVESGKIAVWKTFDLQYSLEEIAQFSAYEYIKNWMFLKGIKGIINTSFILSLIVFGIYTFWKRDRLIVLVFISILIKSIFVLSFSAQYRFFIEVFLVILLVILGRYFHKKYSITIFSVLSISVLSILFIPNILTEKVPSFNVGHFMQGFRWQQLYKPSAYKFNAYDTFQLGNLRFNVPKKYVFDFDVELPSLSLEALKEFEMLNIFPQLESDNIGKGFVWKKLNEKEKAELRKIIEEIEQ